MSGGVEIEIEGLKELNAKLEKLARKATGPEVERAIEKASKPLETEMKRTTAFQDDSGFLRRSIGTVKKGRGSGTVMQVGAKAPHAHLVEFGTKSRTRKSGGSTGVMPKRPFMRPAYDKSKMEIVAIFRDEMAREMAASEL